MQLLAAGAVRLFRIANQRLDCRARILENLRLTRQPQSAYNNAT